MTVPVVWLDAASALAVFDEPVDGIRYGASVGYLACLAGFARDLTERGRLLPTLRWDERGPVACWCPVLTGPDVLAVNLLEAAMPPVCRAERGEPDGYELMMSAVSAWLDVVARAALSTRIDLLPPQRGRRPRRLPAVDAWLSALTTPDGRFEADPEEAASLGEALRPWEEFQVGGTGPVALANWRFRKAPVYMPAGAAPVRLEVRPRGAGALAWVPAELWTSGADPDLTRWAATSVTFQSCPDRMATYFGGLLGPASDTCLYLDVRRDGARIENLTTRLDGADCPA